MKHFNQTTHYLSQANNTSPDGIVFNFNDY